MKTIAIDIDDVISNCAESFITYHNKYYGTSLSLREITYKGEYRWYWESVLQEVIGIDAAEAERRFAEFTKNEMHISGQYINENTKSYIRDLSNNYGLVVITARDVSISEATTEWINRELPYIFNGIYFTYNGKSRFTKAGICSLVGASYLVDDSVDHCNIAAEFGIKPILFGDYGWNSHQKLSDNVYRAKNWVEVIDFFKNEQNT